jgi:hypothetical protein
VTVQVSPSVLTTMDWTRSSPSEAKVFPSQTCAGHASATPACDVSSDGSMALSADFLGVARLWSIATGDEIATLDGHDGVVLSCSISKNGEFAATAGNDGTMCVWHVPSKALRYRLRRPGRLRSAGCSFTPDGRTVVASFIAAGDKNIGGDIVLCSLDGMQASSIRGWTLRDLIPFQVVAARHAFAVCVKSLSGTFSALAMDSETGAYLREWPTRDPPCLSLTQSGDIMAIADKDNLVMLMEEKRPRFTTDTKAIYLIIFAA